MRDLDRLTDPSPEIRITERPGSDGGVQDRKPQEGELPDGKWAR